VDRGVRGPDRGGTGHRRELGVTLVQSAREGGIAIDNSTHPSDGRPHAGTPGCRKHGRRLRIVPQRSRRRPRIRSGSRMHPTVTCHRKGVPMSLSFPWVLRALRSRPVVLVPRWWRRSPCWRHRWRRPSGGEHAIASYVVPEARAADPAPAATAPPAPEAPSTPSRVPDEARGRPLGRRRQGRRRDHDQRARHAHHKPGRGAPHVTVGGHEYDSFEAFVEQAPGLPAWCS